MIKYVKSFYQKMKAYWMELSIALMTALFTSPIFCEESKIAKASESAAKGWQGEISGAIKWILAIVIVGMGAIFIFGSQRKKEEQKEKIPEMIIGVILVVFGIPIAKIIFDWF